jgi:predicted TIM-barrel fold metal-dependent hydrolase
MPNTQKPTVIALEEHYLDPDVDQFMGRRLAAMPSIYEKLTDFDSIRLKEMDQAGIDIQVLSHCPPGAQAFAAETAEAEARPINDRLHQMINERPGRFAAFATLPLRDPAGSARELERCVDKLGFKGAMVHGLTDGLFIDDQRFWPIFERAEALDVPIYIHPGMPHPQVVDIYYKDYVEKFPPILNAGWGFTVETATAGLRMVLSGVFEKHPGLKIILGHLGEGLPFLLWRINQAFSGVRPDNSNAISFRDLFREHFYITTSGNFSDTALACTIAEMGIDRIMFSIDWPYVDNRAGTEWMKTTSLSEEDREKILSGNAKRLLKM